ncbi:MAG: cupredoxin domain-containing protein [Candidatus Omnitrophota bacterium]
MYKRMNILLFILPGVFISIVLAAAPLVAEEMHSHMHNEMGETENNNEEELGICPVMRGEASKDYSYIYKEKVYNFCCPSCVEAFKEDPEKYVSKIKEIEFEAYQFGFSPERITVKKGDIVKIRAASRDVPHGIYIKEYNINKTAKKSGTTNIEFAADKAGEFDILCSVYCGPGHHSMKAKLIVSE